MPIFILPGNRHNLQVFGPQDMPPKKRQPPIDTFFRRTRQKSDGGPSEVIETVIIGDESKISQHQLPCSFCGQNFGNAGALECHRLIKHPGSREVGQSCISVETFLILFYFSAYSFVPLHFVLGLSERKTSCWK